MKQAIIIAASVAALATSGAFAQGAQGGQQGQAPGQSAGTMSSPTQNEGTMSTQRQGEAGSQGQRAAGGSSMSGQQAAGSGSSTGQQAAGGSSTMGSTMGQGATGGSAMQSSTAQAGDLETTPEVIRQVQQALKDKGYDVGPVDGKWGDQTKDALAEFQKAENIENATGRLDEQTLAALEIDASQLGSGGSQQAGTRGIGGSTTQPSEQAGSGSMGSTQPETRKGE